MTTRNLTSDADFTSADRRYERYLRPLPHPVRRTRTTWDWTAPEGGGTWRLHLEHVGESDAPVRMLLIHGAGGNAAAMWPYAAHFSTLGAQVTVIDLPGYGRTVRTARGRRSIRYPDWQRLLSDVVRRDHEDRPLVLVGASMGGMLAVDTAMLTGLAARVVATCLLDPTRPGVPAGILRAPWMAKVGVPLLRVVRGPLREVKLPLRLLTPMSKIANDPGLSREVLKDRRGGGGAMPLGWYRSYLETGSAVPLEKHASPPLLLLHPGEDRWTHPALSLEVLGDLAGETRAVMLPGCGHFPLEEPGFQLLLDEMTAEIRAAQQV